MRTRGAIVAAALVLAAAPAVTGTFGAAPSGSTSAASTAASGVAHLFGGASSVADAVNVAEDGKFVQMDHDSVITLAFPVGVNAEPDGTPAPELVIDIFDSVWPACAHIEGSIDGVTWASLFPGASAHPGCPEAAPTDVAIDSNGNYVDPAEPLGSAAVTGFSDVANVMVDLDAYGGPVHAIRVTQADFIAEPHRGMGFDLDGVYTLNTTPLPAPVEEGCVFSHGYFKNKGSNLVTGLTLGATTYTAFQVADLLKKGGGTDIALTRHLIAFLLSPDGQGAIYDDLVARAHAALAGTSSENASALADELSRYIEQYHC